MDNDPLTNGPPLPRTFPGDKPPAATAAAATSPAPGGVPTLPAPTSSTSPAALTAGVSPSLDPNRDIRIGAGAAAPPGGTAQVGAVLRQPEFANPNPAGVAVVSTPAPGVALTSGGRGDSYQQLQEALASRGVTWQRLEMIGDNGEWKFSCSIPNRQNPLLRKNYEARAASDLAAIRAALDKIDAEQRPGGQ